MSQIEDQVIALAGTFQSCQTVANLAVTGTYDKEIYHTMLKSLFSLNPKTTIDVYGDLSHIKKGLSCVIETLTSRPRESVSVMQYSFIALRMAAKLLKNPNELEKVGDRLERLTVFYGDLTDDVLSEKDDEISYSLSGIYEDLITPVTQRVKIIGKPAYLQNRLTQAQIRTLVFAAIRSAILWYQVGGSRMQFIFGRKKIIQTAKKLLQSLGEVA